MAMLPTPIMETANNIENIIEMLIKESIQPLQTNTDKSPAERHPHKWD